MMIESAKIRTLFLLPFTIWSGLFICAPLLVIIWFGLTSDTGALSLGGLGTILEWGYWQSLKLSVALAIASTIICLLLAYPLCLILVEKAKKSSTLLFLLFILPLWMNSLLSTMAWQTILEKNGILNSFLRLLNMPETAIINTPTAIIIGMMYNYLPYMVLPIYVSLMKIDRSVIEAARDLGASAWQTFFRIILPLTAPGAVSGITMVFIPSLTTFVISALLGGGKVLLIGNIIEHEFVMSYDWHLGSALSVVLMVFIALNMLLMSFTDSAHGKEADG